MGKGRSKVFTWFKRLVLLGLALFALGVALIAYANMLPVWASRGRLFDDTATLPAAKVGLVFGTTDTYKGRENRYFRYRIDAAVNARTVVGSRYPEALQASGDTERMPGE